jgi:hypothetical protein
MKPMQTSKPHPWETYEDFLSRLCEGVKSAGRDIRDLKFGRRNRLIGVSDQAHQVDVSFIDYSFPSPTIVLIECKRVKSVGLIHVKALKATLDDILARPGSVPSGLATLVTTGIFQRGAQKYASYYNLKLQVVGHGPPYRFDYADIAQLGLADKGGLKDERATITRWCGVCKASLVLGPDQQTWLCPNGHT